MKSYSTPIVLGLLWALATPGCSTPTEAKAERGPKGTIAYTILVESSEPGVRVEADQDYVGKTPCEITVYGDKDGSFHNFGKPDYVVKAYANGPGQVTQSKVFRTGWWFGKEDRIPKRIFFDMTSKADASGGGFSVDLPNSGTDKK